MKLSEVRAVKKHLSITFPGAVGTLEVDYKPNTFTADRADAIQAAMADPAQQTTAMFQMVAETIVTWDLEDDDGKVIPLDNEKRLRSEVQMALFGQIFQAIQQDQQVTVEGKASSAG